MDVSLCCSICSKLFNSRGELLRHSREHRAAGVTQEFFWPHQKRVTRSEEDDEGLSEDERSLIEYQREHP